ncbi:MAG: HlyD family secretion protein [Alphaproteobacteria bacterium]|jgi:multidrug resistance efflux pump|nr:HlyD family secretion protein [Alphaproteobacteria bacterium]MBU2163075.1 HlyD family secretion protein [Alphaproteobacteria bacterium]MBU2231724.1 HlyD family secretion protein [Alphaproteobacteria bacterium]TAJ43310.1 MAG: HlyD family secretion protein [Brevundimonas sp.]
MIAERQPMTQAAPSETGPETAGKARRKPSRATLISLAVGLVAILAVLYAWRLPPFVSGLEQTENAYVRGEVTVIAPQVGGYVTEVLVRDFQMVEEGQPLFRIDDRIYRQRVEQARAALAAREAELSNSAQASAGRRAAEAARGAEVGAALAQLERARADLARIAPLATTGDLSQREHDAATAAARQAEAAVRQAEAGREAARQDVRAVTVSRDSLEAAVEGARAALRLAEIDLANTAVTAPRRGQLGQVGARQGQLVTAGTQLVSLVPPERWVIANFKERQTVRMQPGQPVRVTVDGLDDRRFTGTVRHISPAAGSEFALLPAQNATGNFTKVAQRIPIQIVLDPGQDGLDRLRPGMSVVARVDTDAAADPSGPEAR